MSISRPVTPETRSPSRTIRVGFAIVLALVLFVALTPIVADILAVDRGLDITDEGSYLLAADPPESDATWSFPYGWHTRPLLQLADLDVARFRTMGGLLLVLVCGWLGWAAVSVTIKLQDHSRRHLAVRGRGLALPATLGAFTGACGALLYYGGFLRTPSYNWVNLIGIAMTAASQILLIGRLLDRRPRILTRWLLVASGSLGLFYSLAAKPSTPLLLLVAGFGLTALAVGARRASAWTGGLFGGIFVWTGIAVIAGWWPTDFIEIFARLLNKPTPAGTQTIVGAALSTLSIPLGPWRSLLSSGAHPALIVGSGLGAASLVVALFASVTGRSARKLWWLSCVGLSLAALTLVVLPFPGTDAPNIGRWAYGPMTTACLFVVAATESFRRLHRPGRVVPSNVAELNSINGAEPTLSTWIPQAIVVYLGILPFVFSFGSSWGAYDQAANGAGLFLIAAAALVSTSDLNRATLLGASAVAATTLLFSGVVIVYSHLVPYRIPPIATQDVPIEIGRGGHDIKVDPDLAAVLTEIRDSARESGWTSGTPIVGLQWRWSTTIPFALDARVPGSLMITIFGYEGTVERAIYNLETATDGFPFEHAWVVTTTPEQLNALAREQVFAVAHAIKANGGNLFPDDYRCVAEVATFQLWKPEALISVDAPDPSPTCPPSELTSSNYDASFGWRK